MWVDFQAKLIEKNPGLGNLDAKMRISSREFLRIVQMAYHAGQYSPVPEFDFGAVFGTFKDKG